MRDYKFGTRIYNLRKGKGLSQSELGDIVGVSNNAVSKWETGEAYPTTANIIKFYHLCKPLFLTIINSLLFFLTKKCIIFAVRLLIMKKSLEEVFIKYKELGIDKQIDYDRFYLYSLITHSTAIEGSTITELENQIMFDNGISLKGKSIIEQSMNLDLKLAYEKAIEYAKQHTPISTDLLISLSALVMKNTGQDYKTMLGEFSSARGELRLLNVSAGVGGRSYMSYNKVPAKLSEFCEQLNKERTSAKNKSIDELYRLSFDAHYNLVTIHPWADGNGRMARLIMNMLQFEFGLIPTKITKEDKEEYIKALVDTREKENLDIFREFMSSMTEKNLSFEIEAYLKSIE